MTCNGRTSPSSCTRMSSLASKPVKPFGSRSRREAPRNVRIRRWRYMPCSEKRFTGTKRLMRSPKASRAAPSIRFSPTPPPLACGTRPASSSPWYSIMSTARMSAHAIVDSRATMIAGSASFWSERRPQGEHDDRGARAADRQRARGRADAELHRVGEVEDQHAGRHPDDGRDRDPCCGAAVPLEDGIVQLAAREADEHRQLYEAQRKQGRHGEDGVELAEGLALAEAVLEALEPHDAGAQDRSGRQ